MVETRNSCFHIHAQPSHAQRLLHSENQCNEQRLMHANAHKTRGLTEDAERSERSSAAPGRRGAALGGVAGQASSTGSSRRAGFLFLNRSAKRARASTRSSKRL